MNTTYDVRVWTTRAMKGARGTAYQVRWSVGMRPRSRTYGTRRLAESFHAELVSAARKGEPFDTSTGLPVSMRPKDAGPTWLDFAAAFVDAKWPDASPRHRKSTAEGLVTITTAMTTTDAPPPDAKALRLALMHWTFNSAARTGALDPPAEFTQPLDWIAKNTRLLSDLSDPAVLRGVLDAISRTLTGTAASPSTVNRKRAALSSVIGYAIEVGHLEANPLQRVKIKRRKTDDAVDSRVVVNHAQARAILDAVRVISPAMEGYFACIYYAAMRPGEVRNLRERDLYLPESGWGEAVLAGSYQVAGKDWTDTGQAGEERALKHRVRTATRQVPLPPPAVAVLRRHLDTFGTGRDGHLFVTRVGPGGRQVDAGYARPVSSSTVARVLGQARAQALTEAQQRSSLARRAYDLRHAAVSTWLAAGVDSTVVAAWAGHSVAVLLTVYAHAVEGRDQVGRRRIERALGISDSSTAHPQAPVDGR